MPTKKDKAKSATQGAFGISADMQQNYGEKMLGELLEEGGQPKAKSPEQDAYEYALKVYKAKLDKRGPNDAGTREWAAKVELLQPKGGGAGGASGSGGGGQDDKVVMPTLIDGSY